MCLDVAALAISAVVLAIDVIEGLAVVGVVWVFLGFFLLCCRFAS